MASSSLCIFFLTLVHDLSNKATSVSYIMFFAGLNSFVQSGTWSSILKVVALYFNPNQFGRVVTMIGIGARLGVIVSNLATAVILNNSYPWTTAGKFQSCLTLFGLIPLICLKNFPQREKSLPVAQLVQNKVNPFLIWIQFWTNRQFVLVCILNSSISVYTTFEGFDGFSSLFLVESFSLSVSTAATYAIFIPFGLIASLVFGGTFIEGKSKSIRFKLLRIGLLLPVISYFFLLFLTIETSVWVIVLYFLIGFGGGYPYYVLPAEFALLYKEGCYTALITATFETCNSLLGIVFSLLAGKMAEAKLWNNVIEMCLFFSTCGLVATSFYTYYDNKSLQNNKLDEEYVSIEAKPQIILTSSVIPSVDSDFVIKLRSPKASRLSETVVV
jgi:sugar phosphate permease